MRSTTKTVLKAILSMVVAGRTEVLAQQVGLTERGEQLLEQYSAELESLKADISKSVPSVDENKTAAFMEVFVAVGEAEGPHPKGKNDVPPILEPIAKAQSNALERAMPILADIDGFLSSDALDRKLIKCAIHAYATPEGLAHFAQMGAVEEGLVAGLLRDNDLMRKMLVAGGAQMGRYGDAVRIYRGILEAGEHAREEGPLNRFAVGLSCALALPVQERAHTAMGSRESWPRYIDPVARYLHYEKAFLDGELDPAFKTLTAWDCRFIPVSACPDKELAWGREMLRAYRPDHVVNQDYKWRHSAMVKTDIKYGGKNPSIPELGFYQDILNMGGVCGRRAFFGRFIVRAHGMPAFGMTQRGHAALGKWTPDGWTTNFGAHWRWNWWIKRGYNYSGLHFFQESQARKYPADYMKVLRAQWVSAALGEVRANRRMLASGGRGGLWDALSLYKEKAIIAEGKPVEVALAGEDLAEANVSRTADAILQVEIKPEDRKVTVEAKGVVTIPAAACSKPTKSTAKVAFMRSFSGGMQLHYNRVGAPEPFEYTFDAPAAGVYRLTARVATVNTDQQLTLTPNGGEAVEIPLPYSVGLWQQTDPVEVTLVTGRNVLIFRRNDPNYGVSIKEFVLAPRGPGARN